MKRNLLLTTLLLVVALMVAACGGAAATPTATTGTTTEPTTAAVEPTEGATSGEGVFGLPIVDPLSVEGNITIDGSSTVFPLTSAMVENFQNEGYVGEITVGESGTGGGFEAFCVNLETDIADASRLINAEEYQSCVDNGRDPIEFRVGTDAIAVVVNPDNPVSEVTLEQLAQIYTGEITNWNEIDPAAGNLPIQLFSPGTDSGTFDYFVEVVLDDNNRGILAANPQLSEDDNVLVQGVEGSAGGIAYFGFAYYLENEDALKVLTIDGVEPNEATAESNEYVLSRPLFIYSAASIMDKKPQVEAFINYYLSTVDNVIVNIGYFPASDEALQQSADNLINRTPVSMEAEAEETGEPTTPSTGGALPEVDPLSVEGDIVIDGSSTVFPLTSAIAEQFGEEGYAGEITVGEAGTGGGFEAFCVNLETDIADASRPINEEEQASCEDNGLTPVEFRVGTDAIAVVVNPDNPVNELTIEQLGQIYTGQITNWNEIDPAAGDLPIELFSPGTDSGTFDYFVEKVLDDDNTGILAANPQLSEDDNVLVQGVEGSAGGIAYFGFAYYVENAEALKVLTIDGVEPNEETAESNEYVLSRPLFIYSAAEVLAAKPQVAQFIAYYLTVVNDVIGDVGYFPASDDAIQASIDAWVAANPQ